jgi:short subunit dehydrogenase-like uncharacterized protein
MPNFDIVIFGATGYTGTFVVRELAQLAGKEKLSWAVAGRSQAKLAQVLNNVGSEISKFFFQTIVFTKNQCLLL